MGNTTSVRERNKSGDPSVPSSPRDGQAFEFSKQKLMMQGSNDEESDHSYISHHSRHSSGSSTGIDIPAELRAHHLQESEDAQEKYLPTMFKWERGGKDVMISGSFTNWKAIPMVKSQGDFVMIMELPEGIHQYKFLVDGEWKHDPNADTCDNPLGTKNNVINVAQSDFEVFDALNCDSTTTGKSLSGSPPGDYSQELPNFKPWDKPTSPPVLPPHLLQVILNKDTPLSCEPTLLPEPNHVMLNHLYALSIKDHVMVLSATHRYRKKYVTTLLYKPI